MSDAPEHLAPLSYMEKQAKLLRVFRHGSMSEKATRHGGIAVFQIWRPMPPLPPGAQTTP